MIRRRSSDGAAKGCAFDRQIMAGSDLPLALRRGFIFCSTLRSAAMQRPMKSNLITTTKSGPAVIGYVAQEPRRSQSVGVKRLEKAWGQWQ